MNDLLSVSRTHFLRSRGPKFSTFLCPHITSLSGRLAAVRTSHHVTFPLCDPSRTTCPTPNRQIHSLTMIILLLSMAVPLPDRP